MAGRQNGAGDTRSLRTARQPVRRTKEEGGRG